MKTKKILLFVMLFLTVAIFGQTDTATVTTVTTVGTATIYDILWNWISSHAWFTIVITIAVILEQIIPLIKWIPGNSILAVIWNEIKNFIAFVAGKKPVKPEVKK